MKAKSHIPEGFHTINSYLHSSNAKELLAFVTKVFDAEVIHEMADDQGGIRHAEVRIGDSRVELSDACDQWPSMNASIHIYVEDCDATYAKAIEAGAETLSELADQFYGERSASVRDTLGNIWHIATNTEDLTVDEMKQRVADYEAENE